MCLDHLRVPSDKKSAAGAIGAECQNVSPRIGGDHAHGVFGLVSYNVRVYKTTLLAFLH